MLKNETEILNNITQSLGPDELSRKNTSLSELEELKPKIKKECTRIRASWTNLLRSTVKDEVLKRYVPFQQQCILEITDQINTWLTDDIINPLLENGSIIYRECLGLLLNQLLELNDFLFTYFFLYFNQKSRPPVATLPFVLTTMEQNADHLNLGLTNITIDDGLRLCIQTYLGEVKQINQYPFVTYRSKAYLNKFTNLLGFIIDHQNERDMTDRISEALFYLNFNHHLFFKWYKNKVTDAISQVKTANERLLLFLEELIFVKTVPILELTCYDDGIHPINILAGDWLNENINKENRENPQLRSSKLPLNVTVSQLGLLIRLFYDEGFFSVMNVTEILRFLAGCLTSKRQERISAESMRKSFYNSDQFTAAAVKGMLSSMTERINKLFFN